MAQHFTSVDDYIASQPADVQPILQEIRTRARAAGGAIDFTVGPARSVAQGMSLSNHLRALGAEGVSIYRGPNQRLHPTAQQLRCWVSS